MTLFVREMNKSNIRRVECDVVTIMDDKYHVTTYDGEPCVPLKLVASCLDGTSERIDDICDIEVY